MSMEIERKFLVRGIAWKTGIGGTRIRQGYLSLARERTVRIRATVDTCGKSTSFTAPTRG